MQKITAEIPVIDEGQSLTLVNVNGEYIASETVKTPDDLYKINIEEASYDFKNNDHLINKVLEQDTNSFITNPKELQELGKNTQNNVKKVDKINGIAKYYINTDDLIGKVVETVENNVNTSYKINYPNIEVDDVETKNKLRMIIEKFNNQINIEQLIIENAVNTYTEGNFITYLRGNAKKGYAVETYPLVIAEVSNYKIDSEPMITINVKELKSRLNKNRNKYKSLKKIKYLKLQDDVNEEIKANYPEEVYESAEAKDDICFLNPERTGVSRINNLRGLYGVTPIFKALPSQLMLETYDEVDRKNSIAKTKKIYHQILRAELMGKESTPTTKHPAEIGYAQGLFMNSMQKDTVVITSPPYVQEIRILEPKTQETNPATILSYRNRVLCALGISYLSNESKSSFNSVNVNVDELLKTVNKISKQLEKTLNKYYKVVCDDYGIDTDLSPTITIEDTKLIDEDTKLKLADLYYSKLGMSYKSVLELLGLDYNTEISNRMTEKKFKYDGEEIDLDIECFSPHSNSYTANSNDLMNKDGKHDRTEENQNKDKDKQIEDKTRIDNQT